MGMGKALTQALAAGDPAADCRLHNAVRRAAPRGTNTDPTQFKTLRAPCSQAFTMPSVAAADVATSIAKLEADVAQKEARLAQKNEVIAELMEENVLTKKPAGSSERTLRSGRVRRAVEHCGIEANRNDHHLAPSFLMRSNANPTWCDCLP